jgi:hypothetical protein
MLPSRTCVLQISLDCHSDKISTGEGGFCRKGHRYQRISFRYYNDDFLNVTNIILQKISYKVLSILLTVSILLPGCYSTEKATGNAYIHHNTPESWEIQIPYLIRGRGNIHNFDFKKYKDSLVNYLVFNKLQKTIIADSLILIYTKGYSPQSDLKGEITIVDSILTVNLKIPRYNNENVIKRWRKFEFNGSYKLKTIADY